MKKFLLLFMLFILSSCTSYRVVLQTEISSKKLSDPSIKSKLIEFFVPTADMDDAYPGASKYCFGKSASHSSLVFCIKSDKLYVISLYNKRDTENFKYQKSHISKNYDKYEKELLEIHESFVAYAQKLMPESEKDELVYDSEKLQDFFEKISQ